MTILLIAPIMDLPTLLSGTAGADIDKWLVEHRYEVDALFGYDANRTELNLALQKNPSLIIYMGHGNTNVLNGFIPPGNLIGEDNVELLANKVVCTIACLSGQELAPVAISKGVISYFGAIEPMLTAFPELEHNFLADFIDCFTTPPRMILQGKTTQEAFDAYIAQCTQYINQYQTSGWANADWYATALTTNRDIYRLFGKTDAKVADATIPESDTTWQAILAVSAALALGAGIATIPTLMKMKIRK